MTAGEGDLSDRCDDLVSDVDRRAQQKGISDHDTDA